MAGGSTPGQGIPFGDAVVFATEAQQKTGVRAALILAVLQQESAMGRNVGTCNRPQDTRKYTDIMPGPVHFQNFVNNGRSCTGAASPCSWRDDQTVFLQIVRELGLSTDQPLSCPLPSGGWGGAMGPTQFIPSTWVTVRDDVARLAGVSTANPWNARHAVLATGVYMSRLGAANGGFTAERNAACRYYSGRNCGESSVPNTFYGDQVMQKASAFQIDIDFLKDN
ncbi:MAG: lytic murein transglycosylase [Candidatus Pacebacteria bacterium]|nr:lytic murein transglycosylase [Candidatus Paceibacterota bacterium]